MMDRKSNIICEKKREKQPRGKKKQREIDGCWKLRSGRSREISKL